MIYTERVSSFNRFLKHFLNQLLLLYHFLTMSYYIVNISYTAINVDVDFDNSFKYLN